MIQFKREPNVSDSFDVTIQWKEGILVEKFKEDRLSAKEKKIAQIDDIIYIFVGANKRGEGIDVGQTSRPLEVRTNEHVDKGDYLEKFPNEQIVYCGEVKCKFTINRELLEQVEGAIIQEVSKVKGFTLCNENKVNDYKKTYKIGTITNINRTEDLRQLLKLIFIP
jgi:hypothetical protein